MITAGERGLGDFGGMLPTLDRKMAAGRVVGEGGLLATLLLPSRAAPALRHRSARSARAAPGRAQGAERGGRSPLSRSASGSPRSGRAGPPRRSSASTGCASRAAPPNGCGSPRRPGSRTRSGCSSCSPSRPAKVSRSSRSGRPRRAGARCSPRPARAARPIAPRRQLPRLTRRRRRRRRASLPHGSGGSSRLSLTPEFVVHAWRPSDGAGRSLRRLQRRGEPGGDRSRPRKGVLMIRGCIETSGPSNQYRRCRDAPEAPAPICSLRNVDLNPRRRKRRARAFTSYLRPSRSDLSSTWIARGDRPGVEGDCSWIHKRCFGR